ncbi:outer membrane protein assembly factor BamD [Alkalilimnicola sp. S0819]|uniref:outer membrane protein assembly factor BamD n=1 Tax=Alkalilimnicola sp. S0819 TaxID=2613922 RepID=UPI001261DA40|nr:outer membrane protein assembly factor BamD [Alkalilimnicola sp. S0819]KAB7623801.1 outer membrane protein assembly factor BamD [Alkalilimnicola sp. S0819]MPQ16675.1 outer membrane protein assembly factor BamD [Alkalilimnicola sp. S0819]
MKSIKPLLLLLVLLPLGGCSMLGGGPKNYSGDPLNPTVDETADMSVEELYQSAQRLMRSGDYATAVDRLERLQANFPFSTYAKQAQLDTLYAYYQLEESAAVMAAADRYLRANPRSPQAAYVHYMRAMANLNRGRDLLSRVFGIDRSYRDPEPLRQAFYDFQELVERYPDSEYAEDGRKRMLEIREDLARHELHVARHYFENQAYIAAAKRAQGIMEDYASSSATYEALGILARAYAALELEELREDVLRIIRLNYPQHPALEG